MTGKIFTLFVSFLISGVVAAPSSIDRMGLPVSAAKRIGMRTVENLDREAEVWYRSHQEYGDEGSATKHGLEVIRTRSKDRTQHNTDYVEVRQMYYEGVAAEHRVQSVWIDGTLRRREYRLNADLSVEREFTADGRLVRGAKANARGGRAKRERIIAVFDEVYQLDNP